MSDSLPVPNTAAELRRAFDRSFADPPPANASQLVSLLMIRAGGGLYAIRLSDVAALHVGRKIVPLPGPVGVLLGISAFRGGIVPVYDLPALLGHSPPGEAPRWVILTGSHEPLGLAFDDFQGQLRVPSESIGSGDGVDATGVQVRETAHVGGALCPIIHLASVIEAIDARVRIKTTPEKR